MHPFNRQKNCRRGTMLYNFHDRYIGRALDLYGEFSEGEIDMFVQMVLDDRTFHLVKNTPKITGFLGGTKPTPVPEREITGVQTNMTEGKAKPKARVVFEVGDSVRVVEGPFANFSATVEEVKSDKQKVKVSLSMFGRATSVELDFSQVEKA